MEMILTLFSLAFILIGLVLCFLARKFRIPEHTPFFSFNPKYWLPVWKMKEYFRSPGYKLNLIGAITISIGVGLLVIGYLLF